MSSLSSGSDLVIDDDDLEITMEDLSKAEAECFAGPSGGQVLARPTISAIPLTQQKPINQATFQFGATSSSINNHIPLVNSRVSSADPRRKFKPSRSGFSNLNLGGSATDAFSFTKKHISGVDVNINLKRTVNNNSGSSSFSKLDQESPEGHGQNKFMFGSSSTTLNLPDSSKAQIVAPTFSPPHSPSTIADADSQGEDLTKYILMKERHEAKMRTEKLKMEKIEKLIELKKQKQQEQMQQNFWIDNNPSYDHEIRAKQMELVKEELELKRQTTRMLQMQQDMLMKNNADEERRRLAEKKGMLELQLQVKNLEMMLSNKEEPVGSGIGSFSKKPIKNRLGSIKSRLGPRQQNAERAGIRLAGGLRNERKRGHGDGEERTEASHKVKDEGVEKRKHKKYWNAKLPDDLVLTEITDQGPIKKVDVKKLDEDYGDFVNEEEEEYEEDLDRYEYEGELDSDLVLTEFGENGPVKATPTGKSSPSEN